MPRVAIQDWYPVEIAGLEPAAEAAVRDLSNGLIIAGPGAGKTELLAQRACFLMQTGLCAAPQRILAISFKRDAASNLRRRVVKRCGIDVARRFDSLTFDSFAKGLVDRFGAGLPSAYRMTADYEIVIELERVASIRALLQQADPVAPGRATSIIQAGVEERFFRRFVVGSPLMVSPGNSSEDEKLAREIWRILLAGGARSRVSFSMIGRLAELILRTNPKILKALRMTYGFVFLDEFQDTTGIQYALTSTAFRESESILTAVGDPKQRIMLWAGALDGVFSEFQKDFAAKQHGLAMNYRSAPELVRIQQHLIAAIEPGAQQPTAYRKKEDGEGECSIFVYANHEAEARHLAQELKLTIDTEGLLPSEVCILTRTWNDKYSALLISELEKLGLTARVERELQDLLAEPVVVVLLQFSRLAVASRDPKAWAELSEVCLDLWGIDHGTARARHVEAKLAEGRRLMREMINLSDGSEASILKVFKAMMGLLNEKAFKHAHPQYLRGTYYDDILKESAKQLESRIAVKKHWLPSLDDLEGKNSIPIMTIHKSKGLEYHTVAFVGLEDSSLWGFARAPEEEKCGFFVAFSRAIKKVIFTFSEFRPRAVGGSAEKQSRQTIGVLYEMLEKAGVTPTRIQEE